MIDAITSEDIDHGTDYFQASTLQVSTIDVGIPATNVNPSRANATFNVRFNALHRANDVENWLRKKLDGIAGQDNGNYELTIYVSGEAFLTPPGEFSAILANAVTKVTGRTPELSTSGGTSDARFIKNYCPVAEFGMVGATMHKTDECISLVDLEKLTEIYLAFLENYFANP